MGDQREAGGPRLEQPPRSGCRSQLSVLQRQIILAVYPPVVFDPPPAHTALAVKAAAPRFCTRVLSAHEQRSG